MSQNEILAKSLAAARKQSNYTQDEIAEYLQCSRETITNYECGRRSPDYKSLVMLAKKYGVTTDYLLGATNAETTDKDLQYICNYTGLSDKSVNILNKLSLHQPEHNRILDFLIREIHFDLKEDIEMYNTNIFYLLEKYFSYNSNEKENQLLFFTSTGRIYNSFDEANKEITNFLNSGKELHTHFEGSDEMIDNARINTIYSTELLDNMFISEITNYIKLSKQIYLKGGE